MNRFGTCFALLGLLSLPAALQADDPAPPPKPPAQAFKDAAARSLAAAAKQGETNVVMDLTAQAALLRE